MDNKVKFEDNQSRGRSHKRSRSVKGRQNSERALNILPPNKGHKKVASVTNITIDNTQKAFLSQQSKKAKRMSSKNKNSLVVSNINSGHGDNAEKQTRN